MMPVTNPKAWEAVTGLPRKARDEKSCAAAKDAVVFRKRPQAA